MSLSTGSVQPFDNLIVCPILFISLRAWNSCAGVWRARNSTASRQFHYSIPKRCSVFRLRVEIVGSSRGWQSVSGSILCRLKFKMVKDIQWGVSINWILLKLVCYCPCRLETYERNDVYGRGWPVVSELRRGRHGGGEGGGEPKTRLTNTLAALLKFQIGEVRSQVKLCTTAVRSVASRS